MCESSLKIVSVVFGDKQNLKPLFMEDEGSTCWDYTIFPKRTFKVLYKRTFRGWFLMNLLGGNRYTV